MGLVTSFHAANIPSAFQSILNSQKTCPLTLTGTCSTAVPVINFVSTDSITQGASYRIGSPSGNILLYLKGTGLSANAAATEVLIGGKACEIEPVYTSVLQIACRIPASTTFGVKDITVTISSQKATCDSSICYFKYDLAQTPILNYLVPNVINPYTNINFGGIFRATDSFFLELKLNDYYCNLNVVGAQKFTADTTNFAECYLGPLPAGNYNAVLNVLNKGTALQVNTAYNQPDSTGKIYNMTVLPQITSVSSHQGTTAGQVLTITGSGFSNLPLENQVFYGDVPCTVLSSVYSALQCNLVKPAVITQTGLKPGHAGLRRRTFAVKDSLEVLLQSQEFLQDGGEKTVLLSAETEYDRTEAMSEVLEGFFKAPVTGTYKFLISSGGAARLYVSKQPLTKDNLELVAEVKIGTEFRDFYDPREESQISAEIQLTAGEYYYVQAIHLGVDTEHLTIGVTVPSQTPQVNSLKKVISIKVNAEVTMQRGTLKIKKSLLPIQFALRKLTSLIKSLGFSFPGTNSQVASEMASIGLPVRILNRTLIGLGGIVVTNPLLALEVHYSFEFTNTSSITTTTKPLGYPSGFIEVTLDNTPTPLLKGYFEVGLLGSTTIINYDETPDSLRALLLAIPGVGIPRVTRHGDCFQGCEWIVQFDGNFCDLPLLEITSQGTMAGGKSGSLSVNVNILQDCTSNDMLFAPIPHNMLFTAESVPQITVKTYGFLASCLSGQCDYTVEDVPTPTIVDFNLQGNVLEIFLHEGEELTIEQLNVFYADIGCKIISYDAQTQKIVAEISPNDSGALMIVAGVHIPQVIVNSYEMLSVAANVTGLPFLPTITQVDVLTQAVKDGFLGFSITGSGFGYCMDNMYGTTVDIGGVPCAIIALSNEWVFCFTNVIVTSGLINLTVNDLSTNYTLSFGEPDAPQSLDIVSNIVDSTSGEVTLVLNGENFDNTTNVAVLHNETAESSTCSICSYTSSSLTCKTPALAPGNYTVVANTFLPPDSVSQLIGAITLDLEITSIEPHFGSQLGGTVLTITGKGFSSIVNDNQVSMGIMNYRCNVFDATESVIKCTTVANAYSSEGAQTVAVLQRLEYVAQCKGDCDFYYSSLHTPAIYNLSHTDVLAGDHLTIYGQNFTATTEIKIADVLADVVSVSDGEIVVEVPQVVAGAQLAVTAYDPTYGKFVIPEGLTVNHTLQVADYTPKVGSLAGTVLTITGKGFSNAIAVTVGGKVCQVLTADTTKVTCRSPAGVQGAVVVKQATYTVSASSTNYANQQASTPVITAVSNIPTAASAEFTVTFQGTSLNLDSNIQVTLQTAQVSYLAEMASASATSIQAKFTQVRAGNYTLIVQIGAFVAKFDSSSNFKGVVDIPITLNPVTALPTSFAGGLELELTGAGFTDDVDALSVQIEGFNCAIISATFDKITCVVPPLITESTQDQYKFGQEVILSGTYFSNTSNENPDAVFDNTTVTYFKANSSNPNCSFGIDLGDALIAQLTQIQYFPRTGIDTVTLSGSIFEASVDGVQYFPIKTLGTNVYEGWNTIESPMVDQIVTGFRYIRFRRDVATSKCELAEVKVKGILLSSLSNADTQVIQGAAKVSLNGKSASVASAVEYRADKTPVITEISPKNGSSKGNTELHLFGTSLTGTTEVKIDNIICDITSVGDTEIVCTTRALPPVSERRERVTGVINVMVDGNGKAAATGVNFLYAEKWSDRDTWGCGGFPKEYDSVHVETGMNLLIDVSPPRLVAVIVEGALIFEDADITFQAEYVLIRNGFLQIGTEDQPIQSKINITLCGDKANPQLPIFGDKVIGLYEGTVDIHGAPRNISTTLAETALQGQDIIKVSGTVDWKAGERIAISSTNYDVTQTEERTIVNITDNSIGLDAPLKCTHIVRTTDTVEDETFEINAEIILLSRNIMIQGDVDSDAKSYGAHLLFYDPGTESTIVRISHTEITKAGQAGFLGRFPINFQHAGNQMRSYVRGNSIHHTYQRGIQLQGTNYLTVEKNALFAIQGYGINLEDGIERFNTFKENIVLSCVATLQYLSTQENAIGFRISNPTNFFIGNKVISNPSFGYWFDLKSNTAGAYASTKICPRGEKLGAFDNNTAAWNRNDGIKLDNYLPRTYPCRQTQYTDQPNPFLKNPPVPAVFKNNTVIGNRDKGIEASYVGTIVFDGLRAVENGVAAVDIIFADECPINGTGITNSIIVGSTKPESATVNYRGIRLTRSEGLYIENTTFVNFTGTKPAMEIDSMYWNEHYFDSGARTVFVSGLSFISVALRVKFYNSSTHIIRDIDGSLTEIVGGGTVVNDMPHLNGIVGCTSNIALYGGLVCNSSTEFRRIVLYEAVPETLNGLNLKVLRLASTINETEIEDSHFTSLVYRYGRAPVKSSALPFGAGYAYKVFYEGNADFLNLTVELSPHWIPTDAPITLKFNHSAPREDYDVARWDRIIGTENVENSTALWDIYGGVGKRFGDWYHDVSEQALYLNVIGGNGTRAKISGFACRVNCPVAPGSGVEKVLHYWSNKTIWPGGVLPKEGDDVVIPWNWLLILDINPPALSTVEIQGELRFDDTRGENIFIAERIWVRGTLRVGTSEEKRFGQKAKIILNGTKNENGLLINSQVDAGTKVLGITGELLLYGKQVTEKVTLIETVYPGNKTIRTSGGIVGWEVGNFIAITSTYSSDSLYEVFEIESIDEHGNVTVKQAAKYIHYSGVFASSSDEEAYKIDFSTEVILLDRSIRIQGSREDNWGGRVLITEEYYDTYTQTGRADIQHVSFDYCGQYTSKACISFELMSNSSQETTTIVTGAIMSECLAWGVKFVQSQNIIFTKNIILTADQFGIFFDAGNYVISVVDNRIYNIVLKSNTVYAFLSNVTSGIYIADLSSNQPAIQDNIVAGCEIAYVLKASTCGSDNPYTNNIAHSSNVGFLIVTEEGVCAEISGLTAYKTGYGILSYFSASQIIARNLILTDNNVSINLNAVGKDSDKKVITIKDSLFVAFSLIDCPQCYSAAGSCQSKTAIMLGVATQEGKQMPPRIQDRPWDYIWSSATFNAEQVFTNNTFANFQDGLLPQCSNNFILKTNPSAADYTPIVRFESSHVVNVSQENIAFFELAVAEERCGNTACTGLNNVLVKDTDGTLLGKAGSIIPDNAGVVDKYVCNYVNSGNGYYICQDKILSILQFESLDSDKKTRVISPVNISNSQGFSNIINAFKAHDYMTNHLYTRLARFASIIQNNKNYEIEFSGTVPANLQFNIDGADKTDYAIIKVKYFEAKVISIVNANTNDFIHPVPYEFNTAAAIKGTDPCGTNYYDRNDNTINFKITADPKCKLYIKKTNVLAVNIRYDMTEDEFFQQGGAARFIDKVASILKISHSRIRVISITKGSVILDVEIIASSQDATTANTDIELQSYSDQLTQAVTSGDLNVYGSAAILNYSFRKVFFVDENGEKTDAVIVASNSNEKSNFAFGLLIGGLVVALCVVGYLAYRYKKRLNKVKKMVKVIPEPKSPKQVQRRFTLLENKMSKPGSRKSSADANDDMVIMDIDTAKRASDETKNLSYENSPHLMLNKKEEIGTNETVEEEKKGVFAYGADRKAVKKSKFGEAQNGSDDDLENIDI